MFCIKCGASIAEGNKFCTRCGQPVSPGPAPEPTPAAPAPEPTPAAPAAEPTPAAPVVELKPPAPAAEPAPAGTKTKRNPGRTAAIWIVAAALVIALVIGVILLLRVLGGDKGGGKDAALLSNAGASLSAGEYSAAAASYQEYLERHPEDVSATLGLAETYLRMGDQSRAVDLLDQLDLSQDTGEDGRRWRELRSVAFQQPYIWATYNDQFPTVQVLVHCGDPGALSGANFQLYENGVQRQITNFQIEDWELVSFCFQADDNYGGNERRDFTLTMTQAGFDFQMEGVYNAVAPLKPLYIDLVDSDASNYPVMLLRLRITDDWGDPVRDLRRDDFSITEGQRGGTISNRTVTDVYYDWGQEVYMFSYRADPALNQGEERQINIRVETQNYQGAVGAVFTPRVPSESYYEIIQADCSWEEACDYCATMGGHLVTITSPEEEARIIQMAEEAGLKYIWLGGRTVSYGYGAEPYWITDEDFIYSNWYPGEPSGQDRDGTFESCLMLWQVDNVWSWNDQRSDPASEFSNYQGKMGFVCEYD